jgi:hypothetical protein
MFDWFCVGKDNLVRFEVSTVVTMKNAIFCVTLIRTDVPQKRQFLHQSQGVTSQKTAFFKITLGHIFES